MYSLVLSLERDVFRREKFFQQEFAKEFEFFTAIDAKSEIGKEYILKHFDFNLAKKLYKRDISLGEAACTLSHLAMYRYFLQSSLDQYLIICEDDALFSDEYGLLKNIIQSQKGFDVILFGESKVISFKGNWKYKLNNPLQLFPQKFGKYRLGRLYLNYTAGTVGYVIHRRCIEKILTTNTIFWLADDFETLLKIIESEKEKFEIGYLFPKLVIEDLSIKSNLESERLILQKQQRKNKSTLIERLKVLCKTLIFFLPKKYIAYIRK